MNKMWKWVGRVASKQQMRCFELCWNRKKTCIILKMDVDANRPKNQDNESSRRSEKKKYRIEHRLREGIFICSSNQQSTIGIRMQHTPTVPLLSLMPSNRMAISFPYNIIVIIIINWRPGVMCVCCVAFGRVDARINMHACVPTNQTKYCIIIAYE